MPFQRFMAAQLAHPRGLFGRWVLAPELDRLNRQMNALTLAALDPRPGERVLEVGFGGGALLRDLIAAGVAASGLDRSRAMVARARRLPADIRLGAAQAMPFADGAFDKACTVNTVYFWEDLAAPFGEFYRVMRPAGTLAVCFNPPEELAKWPGHRFGFRLRGVEEIGAALRGAGFAGVATTSAMDAEQGEVVCLAAVRT